MKNEGFCQMFILDICTCKLFAKYIARTGHTGCRPQLCRLVTYCSTPAVHTVWPGHVASGEAKHCLHILSILHPKIERYFCNLHSFKDMLVPQMFACLRKVCQCVQPCPRPARSSARHCRHTAARVWDQRQWLTVSTLQQSGLHQLELVRAS